MRRARTLTAAGRVTLRPTTDHRRACRTCRRRLNPELRVEPLPRVADHRERQIDDMTAQLLVGGVEHHDLTDAGRLDLVVPPHHRLQMHVADWAPSEPPELQMNNFLRVRNPH